MTNCTIFSLAVDNLFLFTNHKFVKCKNITKVNLTQLILVTYFCVIFVS